MRRPQAHQPFSLGTMPHGLLSCDSPCLCISYVGCLLAYRVRAAFEMFHDARYIANSVYIFTLTAVVIAGVQAGINTATQMQAIFFIRSIGKHDNNNIQRHMYA